MEVPEGGSDGGKRVRRESRSFARGLVLALPLSVFAWTVLFWML